MVNMYQRLNDITLKNVNWFLLKVANGKLFMEKTDAYKTRIKPFQELISRAQAGFVTLR